MPNRHLENTAAALLTSWTDSDTAMQIVGTSLGLFGPGLLDPTAVLGHETPLRNALFDVLLSLVEGGALDLRPTEGTGYAFRFRTDFEIAAFKPDTSRSIDIDTPSPYLDELIQVRRERDEALGRADFAEALAAERERMLRLGDAPRKRPIRRAKPPAAPPEQHDDAPAAIEPAGLEAEEASDATAGPTVPAAVAAEAAPQAISTAAAAADDAPPAAAPESVVVEAEPEAGAAPAEPDTEPEPEPVRGIAGLPPEPVLEARPAAEPDGGATGGLPPAPVLDAPGPTETGPTAESSSAVARTEKEPVKKTAAKKPTAKKPAAKKAATKKPTAKKPAAKPATSEAVAPVAAAEIDRAEPDERSQNEVVYLTPPTPADTPVDDDDLAQAAAADDADAHRAKWSGYTLDKPRGHLASVDSIAEEG